MDSEIIFRSFNSKANFDLERYIKKTFYILEKKINKYHSSDLKKAPLLNIGPAVADFFLFCFKNVCFKDNHWD